MSAETENDPEGQTHLTRAAKRLATARSVDEVVSVLRAEARAVAGSDGIAVILREGDTCHYVAEDAIEPLWRGKRFPMSLCVSGWAIQNRASVAIPDLESDPRVPQEAYSRTSMRSLVVVPMGMPEPLGALGAYWCAYMDLDVTTIRRLEILAEVAGAALMRVMGVTPAADEHEWLSDVKDPALTADA